MAKTFYKYVQRDQEARVNWADVAKDFSDSLKEEAEDRQRRKDELKQAQDEYLKYVQEPPQGDNQTLNSNIQGFANSAMEQATVMYDLLTSGQLNPRDYKMNMQNLADDTQGLYDVWTQYSEDYTSMLERQNVPEGQLYSEGAEIEGFMWQNMEFFSNFENFKPTIDPTSGRVYYAKVDKDGNISTNPNDRASIMDLRTRLRTKYDNVDVDSLTTKVTDQIGNWAQDKILKGEKGVLSLQDARGAEGSERRKQYDDYKRNSINALMVNKIDNATILTNHVGTVDINGNQESYTFTWDPEEAKTSEKFILLTKDKQSGQPQPQLTSKQEETVRNYLDTRIEIKLDEVTKIREHYKPKNYSGYNASKSWKRKQDAASAPFDYIVQLAGSTNVNEKQAALSALSSLIQKDQINGQKVQGFSYTKDGNNYVISYTNNGGQAKSITVTPSMDVDDVIDNMLYDFVPSGFDLNYAKKNRSIYKDMGGADVLQTMKDTKGGTATGIKKITTTTLNNMSPDELQSRIDGLQSDLTKVVRDQTESNETSNLARQREIREMIKQSKDRLKQLEAKNKKGGGGKTVPRVPKPTIKQ